jgi:hypothetical protein
VAHHGWGAANTRTGERDADRALARLVKLGVALRALTEKLLTDGITAFTHS